MKKKIIFILCALIVPMFCSAEEDKELKNLEKSLKNFMETEGSYNQRVVKRFVMMKSELEKFLNARFDMEECASNARYELAKMGCETNDDEMDVLIFWIEIEEILFNSGIKYKLFLPVNRTFGLCSVMGSVIFNLCSQPLFREWGEVLLELGIQNYIGETDEKTVEMDAQSFGYAIAS